MKLIKEISQDLKFLTEASENGKKSFYNEGIFMQADKHNRKGRLYPKAVMEKEIKKIL